jgi:non-ribosomal peptide synthetase component F
LAQRLNTLAGQENVTLYILFLAVFNVFISKLCGQEDIVVGSAVSGRRHSDLTGIIGMFVNMLIMRNFPAPWKTFIEFLQDVKENSLKAYENQDYQFDRLVDALGLERKVNRNPLYDIGFEMENPETTEIEIPGLILEPYEFETKVAKIDLLFAVSNSPGGIRCSIEYSTRLFEKETIEIMSERMIQLMDSIVDNPRDEIQNLDFSTAVEKELESGEDIKLVF